MIPTLKTKRLTLRPLSISDRDAMVDKITSDMDVMYWLPGYDAVSTLEGQQEVASAYITNFIKPWDELGFGVWAVCINDIEPETSGTFIGYCGFIPEQIEGEGPEIAGAVEKSMWGKGLMTEAITACLNWIFLMPEISRVYAVTDEENTASRRLMEKVGMKYIKDVDLYDSVANGEGLLPLYSIDRNYFLDNLTWQLAEKLSYEQPVLTEAERHKILVEWNDTDFDYPHETCLHQLFETQVKKNPDAIALIAPRMGSGQGKDLRLTYQQLDQKANQLAHYLKKLGVTPETLIGICIERSPEMIIGLLGILKAGSAYVPLDPHTSDERMSVIIDDTHISIVLTRQNRFDRLSSLKFKTIICLDTDWHDIADESESLPAFTATSENLAAVIYTSGSTGLPKGVMLTHRGFVNGFIWDQHIYQLNTDDKMLHQHSIMFDFALSEIFNTFTGGAALVLAEPEFDVDPEYLVALIRKYQITIAGFVPSQFSQIIDVPDFKKCLSLREVDSGGESLTQNLVNRYYACLSAPLYNSYGPTEASIDIAHAECATNAPEAAISIGRPIGNTQIYILDQQLRPVPVGLGGEIYIGGDCLARGYLNRPELTAEKFISNPFGTGRLYRTGDLARYLPDGNIEFLGRTDHQVKLRGYRIELGEIENALGQYEGIKQTVVLLREDIPTEKQLVAYLITDSQVKTHDLITYLQQKLPDYMIPAAFVQLEQFPLTPNGKIDRLALPQPDLKSPSERDDALHNTIEKKLCGIWNEVFHKEWTGTHDNFFELGGHSLHAMQIVTRIQQIFDIDFPVRKVFYNPTFASMAAEIQTEIEAEEAST